MVSIPCVPKSDEEEQKELNLDKQHQRFMKETKEWHQEVTLIFKEKYNLEKMEEAFKKMKARQKDWNSMYKKLGEAAVEATMVLKQEFKKIKINQEEKGNEINQQNLEEAKEFPNKKLLLEQYQKLKSKVHQEVGGKVTKLKQEFIDAISSIQPSDVLIRAGCTGKRPFAQLINKCDQEIRALNLLQGEIKQEDNEQQSRRLQLIKKEYLILKKACTDKLVPNLNLNKHQLLSTYFLKREEYHQQSEEPSYGSEDESIGMIESEDFPMHSNYNGMDQSEFLFQIKRNTHLVSVFDIAEQELRVYKLPFTFPISPGMCHFANSLYFAGGQEKKNYFSNRFTKINSQGRFTSLQRMPNWKSNFPMIYSHQWKSFYTVGGWDKDGRMDEATVFTVLKNQWNSLPDLPSPTVDSAATVNGDVLLNIGGQDQSHYFTCLYFNAMHLGWKDIKVSGGNFRGFQFRSAAIIKDKVIFFGSNNHNYSCILEKEIKRENFYTYKATKFKQNIPYAKAANADSSFCTLFNVVYAFPQNSYDSVFRFDLGSKTWTKFY